MCSIKGQFHKGIIGNYHFLCQIPLGKQFGSHNMSMMTVLYNEVCYKGTALNTTYLMYFQRE